MVIQDYTSEKPGVDSDSYYKEIAIKLAWDLLANVYCLDKDNYMLLILKAM